GAAGRAPASDIPAPRRAGSTARALPSAITSGEQSRRIRLPRGFTRDQPAPSKTQGQSSAGRVTLILALLLVMVVLGIVVLAGFIDTISSVFD
ncbi:hypothetical protein, partial [Actinophytocola sp.]|uniref:hypothetical protein n=1 Tax=Actinophytocola sp. TaxID=1872138 RepID=UPI003D6A642F